MSESKIASMEWGRKYEPTSLKTRPLTGKVLVAVFFDWKGLLPVDYLYERQTHNAAYYCHLLGSS